MNGRVMPTAVLPGGNVVCGICHETFCREPAVCRERAGLPADPIASCDCSLCIAFRTPSRIEQRVRVIELAARVDALYDGGGKFEKLSQELADAVLAYFDGGTR